MSPRNYFGIIGRTLSVLTLLMAALVSAPPAANALANGLALTPPMGWNSWNQTRCNGLNENVVKAAADNIVAKGLKTSGFQYVVVDDCWQGGRDNQGALFSNPKTFPSGIKALADYVHAKGLKFGIYSVPGSQTCANYWDAYPITGVGSLNHESQDATTFANWGVDYLKYDWCRADVNDGLQRQPAFEKMRDALKATGRSIVYGISEYGDSQPWTWATPVANLWRTTNDIQPNWTSIAGIIDSQAALSDYAGPGHWNDPDMLQIGNGSLSAEEIKSHYAMWAMLAAPLFLGTDLANLPPTTLAVLNNKDVVSIDQDTLGQQAKRLSNTSGKQVWSRKLSNGDYAIALYNNTNAASTVSSTASAAGFNCATGCIAKELWTGSTSQNSGTFTANVPAHGTVLYRVTPASTASVSALVNAGSQRCLDVPVPQISNGSLVSIWDCNGGTNQQWTSTPQGELRIFGNKCLDLLESSTALGADIGIWDCNGGTNQQWTFKSDGTLQSKATSLCLDVLNNKTSNGSPVKAWSCNAGSNQRWSINP